MRRASALASHALDTLVSGLRESAGSVAAKADLAGAAAEVGGGLSVATTGEPFFQRVA
jgi:hypothetical protein